MVGAEDGQDERGQKIFATYTQEQLDGIVNSRTARAEQSALRSFFQQQGMSENEVTQQLTVTRNREQRINLT